MLEWIPGLKPSSILFLLFPALTGTVLALRSERSEGTCVSPEYLSLHVRRSKELQVCTLDGWRFLYDVQQVDDFGCSSMDSLRRSSGTVPSGPQTLSSP